MSDDTAIRDDARRRDRYGDLRARAAVLDTTLAMLAEVGYQRLRIEAVAARAGVGRTLLRRLWVTRPLLVAEALQRVAAPPEVLPSGDVRDELRELVGRWAAFVADPVVADALAGLSADATTDPLAAERFAALLAPRRAVDTSVLLSAVARGDLPADVDIPLLLDLVLGTLLLRRALRARPDDDTLDALAELLADGVVTDDYSVDPGHPAANRSGNGYGGDGHGGNGHGGNGQGGSGYGGNGQGGSGHAVDGHVLAADLLDGHALDGQGADGYAPDAPGTGGHPLEWSGTEEQSPDGYAPDAPRHDADPQDDERAPDLFAERPRVPRPREPARWVEPGSP